jgi:DNA-binding transcriptional MerR regulator
VSEAVADLAADASALGVPVSARQIERWRQLGLIPKPQQRALGRGRGSVSAYPGYVAAQAAEIARLLRTRNRLDDVAMLLFCRGYEVDETALKRAYVAHLELVRRRILRRSKSKDTLTIAEAATRTLLRAMRGDARLAEWRARLRGRDEPASSILESALTNFMHVLLVGQPASEGGLREFLDAGGLTAAAAQLASEGDDPLPFAEIAEMLAKLDLGEYSKLVERYTVAELRAAEQTVTRLVEFATRVLALRSATAASTAAPVFELLVSEMDERVLAFGLPLAAWILEQNATGAAEVLDAIDVAEPELEAVSILIERLPQHYWHFLGEDGAAALETADEDERAAVQAAVHQALDDHELQQT